MASSISEDLKELQKIFDSPRIYIIEYFARLINNVDVACEKFLISQKGTISNLLVVEMQELIIERINATQDICLQKLNKDWFNTEQVKTLKKTINSIQELLESCLLNNIRQELVQLDELLYDCKTKLLSLLFYNKVVVFLTKDNFPMFNKLGQESFGSLLIVQDEFIGNRAFDILCLLWKNEYHEKNITKITNDLIKVDLLINKLKGLSNAGTTNQIIEINLGLSKQTFFQLFGKTFTSRLEMSNGASRTLTGSLLDGFFNLKSLNLASCHLIYLHSETFRTLKQLQIVNLSNNRLSAIDSNIFKGLDNLESINLSHNRLSNLTGNILYGLNNLKSIDLSYNFIAILDVNIFQGLVNLRKIFLISNGLIYLDTGLFDGLKNLQTIDISRNKINSINTHLFNGLHNLETLSLSYNNLQSINTNTFLNLHKLKSIDLKENQIRSIDGDSFKGLISLSVLLLCNNQLMDLDSMLFQGLINLEEIDLSNNQITYLDLKIFNGLANLKQIHLRRNRLKMIDLSVFHSFNNITHICLTENEASNSLDSHAFKSFDSLKEINLTKETFTLFDNIVWSRIVRIINYTFDIG